MLRRKMPFNLILHLPDCVWLCTSRDQTPRWLEAVYVIANMIIECLGCLEEKPSLMFVAISLGA